MSGIWKHNIGLSIFGESHGDAVGITISSLPPGFEVDLDYIQREMNRRRPGQNPWSTPRNENDEIKILSGVFKGKTTGAPLTMIIENKNIKSKDYDLIKDLVRPGHADHTAFVKYNGYQDYRGGGHFSGRLTAGLVFAGALCKSILSAKNILIGGQITKIGMVRDHRLENVSMEDVRALLERDFPTLSLETAEEMKSAIREAKDDLDSIGGEIRCFALNLPAGVGNPFFDGFESILSQLIFSIPGIKGLAFGTGFKLSDMQGSTSNDAYYTKDEKILTRTNHNGGIIGGITNGMPVDFTVVVKATPSIGKLQNTINIETLENTTLSIEGRHDPCIVPRVVPVVEAVTAIAILDGMLNMF
ncbi:MAG: chorismate synthase [Clostridia bacterium]|nr:chorismate synthase [Clostridia bacterium]